jgi:hypothetical protein
MGEECYTTGMKQEETIADQLSDAHEAMTARKTGAEKRPTVRLAFRFLQGLLFVLFAWGVFGRLFMAVSAEGFSWQLWLNLLAWVGAGALYFGFWRPGR